MTSRKHDYDLLVIGTGPAGIHAAVQAAKLNKSVAIIEKNSHQLGGAWLHTGTIPSKTMREVLATIQSIKPHLGEEWVSRLVNTVSAHTLRQRASLVSQEEETLLRRHLTNNDITLIVGHGALQDPHHVCVTEANGTTRTVSADYMMLATGSRPRRPADVPFDDWRVVDSDSILKLDAIPRSVIIYGAGVIGCEYACIFGALGVQTILVDARKQLMPFVDREISEALRRSMEDLGIHFMLGKTIDSVRVEGSQAIASIQDEEWRSDILFFAAGRESATRGLGLETVGIDMDKRGTVLVNDSFQTSIANIYAAGDIIGAPALASTSMEQGRYAACHAFGKERRAFPSIFPIGIYTIPELSSVGKTEEELNHDEISYVVGRASFDEIARGFIRGDNHGLLKILACRDTQKILGIHILGADAANLIHVGQCCMIAGMTLHDIVNNMIFNYPTLAEAYRIAAFNALNKSRSNGIISSSDKKPEESHATKHKKPAA